MRESCFTLPTMGNPSKTEVAVLENPLIKLEHSAAGGGFYRSVSLPAKEEMAGGYLQRRPAPSSRPVCPVAVLSAGVFAVSVHLGHALICVEDYVVTSILGPAKSSRQILNFRSKMDYVGNAMQGFFRIRMPLSAAA